MSLPVLFIFLPYFVFLNLILNLFFFLWQLTLRWVMDEAKKSTKSGSLNEVSMVLLNNLLSLPFAIVLIFLFGEWDYVMHVWVNIFSVIINLRSPLCFLTVLLVFISRDVVKLPMFWVFATASGLLGLSISFTSMWFLHQTGPTTYRYHVYYF